MSYTEDYCEMSGVELMLMEFPQHRFCIQDILPKGLNVLCAESMDNARSMAMDWSLRVAAGQELWDMEVQQGTVLHMIHKDTLVVVRNRIISMTNRVPDDLYIGVMSEDSLTLPLSVIPAFVKAHPDTSLIVIELETPVMCVSQKLYVPGELLLQYGCLKELALEKDISILVVQRAVNAVHAFDNDTVDGVACISNTLQCHYELEIKENRGVMNRISRSYGKAQWDVEYSLKSHRWSKGNISDCV